MNGDGSQIPPAIARKIALGVRHGGSAIMVGNRAGVIEWANDAWRRITGYALDASVSKPVLTFLERIDVDPKVLELVARCFHDGRACQIELPVHPSDRGPLRMIRLWIDPLRDASGEVSDFVVTATEVTERQRTEHLDKVVQIDLSVLAARVARDNQPVLRERTQYEFDLALDLPYVLANESLLEGLVARLVCRAAETIDEGWGTLTLSSGILGGRSRPIFSGNLRLDPADGHYVFLEVHDTGSTPSARPREPIAEPFLSDRFPHHPILCATADLLLQGQSGKLRIESTPWGGTSVVILLPFA